MAVISLSQRPFDEILPAGHTHTHTDAFLPRRSMRPTQSGSRRQITSDSSRWVGGRDGRREGGRGSAGGSALLAVFLLFDSSHPGVAALNIGAGLDATF